MKEAADVVVLVVSGEKALGFGSSQAKGGERDRLAAAKRRTERGEVLRRSWDSPETKVYCGENAKESARHCRVKRAARRSHVKGA